MKSGQNVGSAKITDVRPDAVLATNILGNCPPTEIRSPGLIDSSEYANVGDSRGGIPDSTNGGVRHNLRV